MHEDSTLEILVWVLPLGGAAIALYWLLRRHRPVRAPTPPADVPAEFRRRRRSCFRHGLTLLAGFGAILLSYPLFTIPLPGLLGSNAFAVSFAVLALLTFAIGTVRLWAEYRCPACEQPLTKADADGDSQWLLNPTACPRCGTRLV